MLQDPINYLYFHFLSPVVSEFERVNAYFQATDIEASEAVRELNTYYSSLRGRVYNSSGDILPTERVDYGAKFIYEADALIRRNKNDQMTVRKVREDAIHCFWKQPNRLKNVCHLQRIFLMVCPIYTHPVFSARPHVFP